MHVIEGPALTTVRRFAAGMPRAYGASLGIGPSASTRSCPPSIANTTARPPAVTLKPR
jgi:hypothetical protein